MLLSTKGMIKEICVKLELKMEMINDVLDFVNSFHMSKTHCFKEEVVLASSIYLSCKINEDFKRIRGIP
jgi:hypothetical protein